ncbi:hypothetical protein NOCARDAX2BIS_250035 [Nocardioides sp. AX2bis]|nr:hypothetical protein NOCARDAX2BIS_250035 [Nocardioides sp. AX2bis]
MATSVSVGPGLFREPIGQWDHSRRARPPYVTRPGGFRLRDSPPCRCRPHLAGQEQSVELTATQMSAGAGAGR